MKFSVKFSNRWHHFQDVPSLQLIICKGRKQSAFNLLHCNSPFFVERTTTNRIRSPHFFSIQSRANCQALSLPKCELIFVFIWDIEHDRNTLVGFSTDFFYFERMEMNHDVTLNLPLRI